jgi:hypothetical protein
LGGLKVDKGIRFRNFLKSNCNSKKTRIDYARYITIQLPHGLDVIDISPNWGGGRIGVDEYWT